MTKREIEKTVTSEHEIWPAMGWVQEMTQKGLAAGPVVIRLGRERRSLDQNSKLWPMLTDISKQVEWLKDGEKAMMSPDEWKDLFTASLKQQSMAPGIEGGMVVLGMRTSKMNKELFSQLIELIMAFGSERGIAWSEPAKDLIQEYGATDGA